LDIAELKSYSFGWNATVLQLGLRIEVRAIMHSQPDHILILEDEPKWRKITEFGLTKAGFRVTMAAEATKALLLAQQEHFDLVLSDYYLPDYPGTDFIRLLREIDDYQCVPVILWSARLWELNEHRLRDELSVLLMSKGCSMSELVDNISGCLAIARSAP